MCGIFGYIENSKSDSIDYVAIYKDFMSMKSRGPDMSVFQTMKNVTVGFHRLAIMDPTFHANQPYILEDGERTIVFLCNGEIYNFKELIQDYGLPILNNSDCMVIPRLYLRFVKYNVTSHNNINTFVELFKSKVKGEFAFILFEFDKLQNIKEVICGRDTFGVRPLYIGTNKSSLSFSSEVKGLNFLKGNVSEFNPGNIKQYYYNSLGNIEEEYIYDFKKVYDVKSDIITLSTNIKEQEELYLKRVRDVVINSVKRRLTADRPIAFLLSGGVDSSLVCGISARLLDTPIRTFCCGMLGGTDLKYAKQVANHIGSNHTEVIFTPEEGLQKIRDVIKFTETWDTTSIRASIGQHIVCEYIAKNTDAKVVLVGEGSDELCGSYATFWSALNAEDFHDGCVEYLKEIHLYDGRRVDRNVSNFGLEARLSLLDPELVETYHMIPKEWRRPQYKGIEKYWLRQAFNDTNLLPQNCLFRKKEAFSDGVSSTEKSWYQILQEHIETLVSDDEFTNNKWNVKTKEAYYYKKVFCELFGESRLSVIPHYWQPKFLSDGTKVDFENKDFYIDPSARILTSVYKKEDQE